MRGGLKRFYVGKIFAFLGFRFPDSTYCINLSADIYAKLLSRLQLMLNRSKQGEKWKYLETNVAFNNSQDNTKMLRLTKT